MGRLPPVVVNDQAGRLMAAASTGQEDVSRWLDEISGDTNVIRAEAADCVAAIERLLEDGHERIAVGGGDGTLRSTAALIDQQQRSVEVVFLPLGTHNHFAKDLGVPLDVEAWTGLLESPTTARIDLGEVNGQLFLNNLSLGLYPAIVQQRQMLPRERLLGSKRIATLWSVYRIWRSLPRAFVARWRCDNGATRRLRTRLLVVSNNQYADEPLAPLSRDELQGGRLTLYAPRSLRLGSAANMAWHALKGELDACPQLEVVRAEQFCLELSGREVELALDGELLTTDLPLDVRVRKRALTVVMPSGEESSRA